MNRPIKFRGCPILPEFYEVSDAGHVVNEKGKALKQWKDRDGYPHVTLVRKPHRYVRAVHKLVAEAFHGARPTEKHQVNHKNGKRDDNRAENLEWVTSRENTLHGWANGRKPSERQRASARTQFRGECNPKAKTTWQVVEWIRRDREKGLSLKEIAAMPWCGLSVSQVSAIATKRNWV